MKQLKAILFAILVFIATVANASRIPEIEQYYIDKVSSLLKTRFPETPFTVFVQVDVGDRKNEDSRKKEIRRGDVSTVQLPYLEVEDDEDISVWNRTDVPLGTLVGLLERVVVRVQIDSTVDESELKDLQDNLAKQLKLDAKADTIEIARVPFNQAEKQKQKLWWVLGMFMMILAVSTVFYFLARHSVRALVKGLAQPISEIGKSTQEFANSALNMAADLSQPSSVSGKSSGDGATNAEDELSLGSNLIEIRKSALELITRNQNMFKNPDSRFLSFLEQQGTDNPTQMGAILAELDQEAIKTLYKYGWGTWWFTALASPAPLTPTSIRILSEIDRLRLRWHFNDDEGSEYKKSNQEAGLVFGRLNDDELVTLLKDVQLGDAEPIFDLLPRSQALSVAKKLYPGQWAKLLETNKSAGVLHVLNAGLVEKLTKKALEIRPLRKEVQIQNFFADLDLVKYLDIATPRDEKDFYMVLPKDSKIKAERFPFYEVFEASAEVKKMMGADINAKDWAYVLMGCEQSDQKVMLEAFSDRLRFMIQEIIVDLDKNKVDNHKVRNIRKAVIQSYFRHSENIKFKSKDIKDETPKTKAA